VRRRGHGTALLTAVGPGERRFWAHGDEPGARAFAEKNGFERARVLWQMRRSLTEPLADAPWPPGVTFRHFRPGSDEDAWLAVNARAFAHHPEQGRWTRADIEARERESWFDADGFFLAWRGDELLGFHWTKVHPDGAGEVYVIGIAPAAQGLGLGTVLLLIGLDSLHRRGCPEVLLYVDGSNTTAMALYEKYGFARHDVDVQWSNRPD
jgi:mycothiol synthase